MRFLPILVVAALLVTSISLAKDEKEDEITCSCGVFGERGADQLTTNPLLVKSIPIEAHCDQKGKDDCAILCKSIAEAGAAQNSNELCSIVENTPTPIKPTIYSKTCGEREWTYAGLTATKDYCCAEDKHTPCPEEQP